MDDNVSRLKDRHGNDLVFKTSGDLWFFPSEGVDFRDQLKEIRHLELRDGDVILASYPRSGTFWHYQIIIMLMNNSAEYTGHVDRDHLEWRPSLYRPPKPWLYPTHVRFRMLPEQVREKKVKVIYAYRNPKDVWASCYTFQRGAKLFTSYEGTWSHFFDLMMDCGYWYGNWFDHIEDWEEAIRGNPDLIFPSCYELMKKDPVEQMLKIDQFLGLNRGRALCEQIAEACEFSALKAAKEVLEPHLHGRQAWEEGTSGFYRKGEVGDWKNWFTVAQSEQLDAVFNKRMSGSKLPFFFQ